MNARHRSAESSGARAASSAESSTGHPPAGFLSSGELLGLLYQGLPAALTANGLIALALMAVQWQVVDGHRAIAWLIAMSAILALRAGLYLGYRRSAADPSAAGDKWLTPFRLGTIITGVLWGAATPVFYPHGDLAHQLALTFVLSGVCAGAATTLAADRVSALGFIGPTLLPVMIALLAEGGDIRLMMGSLGALFLLFVSASAERTRRYLLENAHLRRETWEHQKRLDSKRQLIEDIESVQSRFIQGVSRENLLEGMLIRALALSGSKYGILGEVDRTDRGRFSMTSCHVSHAADHAPAAEVPGSEPPGTGVIRPDTLIGAALDSGKPAIANDLSHDLRPSGLLVGHPPLATFLAVPVLYGGKPLALLGLANRPHGYDEAVIEFLGPLLITFGQLLHAARTLQQQHEDAARLRGLFEFSPVGIALSDYATGAFVAVNKALLAPTGYSREELLALSYRDLTPEGYEAQEARKLQSLEETGRYGPYENEYVRKDGRHYPVLLNGMLVHDPSGKRMIWSIVEDISERKRVERMKIEFISIVSHELRTPLTSITGALGLAVGGALGELPPQARQIIAIAHKNGQRLSRLVNDLLDLEKLLIGEMTFDTQARPLLPLVEEALESNQIAASEHEVILRLHNRAPGAEVLVDGERLLQVLSNLLSNALKYSPEQDTVEVAVERRGPRVRVTVTDHGPGVPGEFRERIFQKFARADSSDSRQRGGTGLGLAITKELIERMGGMVGFESTEGSGANFYFELPAVDPCEASAG